MNVMFSGIAAVAGLLAAGAAFWLLFDARQITKTQQRAYVGVESLDFVLPGLDPSYRPTQPPAGHIYYNFVFFTIRNAGNSPALDLQMWANWASVSPFGNYLSENFNYPLPESTDTEISRSILMQQQTVSTRIRIPEDNLNLFGQAIQKMTTMFVYGKIDYRDIYGRKWCRDFAYSWEHWQTVGSTFVPAHTHNSETQCSQRTKGSLTLDGAIDFYGRVQQT